MFDPQDLSRLEKIERIIQKNSLKKVKIVSMLWISDSADQHEDLDEREYSVQ